MNCPKVLEREHSAFGSLYFVAETNEPDLVRALVVNDGLDLMERLLVSNARTAAAMVTAITHKDMPLFQALDREITAAKLAIGDAEKLFLQHAGQLPHLTELSFQGMECIRVVLVGDFGNGERKTAALLDAIFKHARPNVLVHLGDVYKRGSKREQQEHLIEPICTAIERNVGAPASVFAVCGNHDVMARGGAGYYWALREMCARGLSEQDASFFCIHVGESFAIIGLDTSLEGLKYDSDALETRLNDAQVVWLQQRMDQCRVSDRRVILLFHHPLLSCGAPQGPSAASAEFGEGVNPFLWSQLSPHFDRGELASAWFTCVMLTSTSIAVECVKFVVCASLCCVCFVTDTFYTRTCCFFGVQAHLLGTRAQLPRIPTLHGQGRARFAAWPLAGSRLQVQAPQDDASTRYCSNTSQSGRRAWDRRRSAGVH